jgi:hypothetical protein
MAEKIKQTEVRNKTHASEIKRFDEIRQMAEAILDLQSESKGKPKPE